jgi:hypothetical protein
MKFFSYSLAVFCLILLLNSSTIAQNEEPPLLVVSMQKIKISDLDAANNLINEKFAPILNRLVDEGKLNGWGLFNHAWGDEWNANMWYVTKDMNMFSSFWDEYMNRVSDQQSAARAELREYIQEHKNNMYIILNQYPGPASE